MNAQTRLSAKGQVVIPKGVRDRLGLTEGMILEVSERGDELVFTVPRRRTRLTVEEAQRRIREIFTYDGPRIDDHEIARIGPKMAAQRDRRSSKQPIK